MMQKARNFAVENLAVCIVFSTIFLLNHSKTNNTTHTHKLNAFTLAISHGYAY